VEKHQFIRVDFYRFKAFRRYTLHLKNFNVIVGPNNSGKSTILTAFRILAAALRKAKSRNPEMVPGPEGRTQGYSVDLRSIAIAEENLFYNYNDDEPAQIQFTLSNKNKLTLFFPEPRSCYLIAESHRGIVQSTKSFKAQFNCPIGFVPILGPVDHNEQLYDKEAARLALFNYRAARNFRNIWYHYPEKFEEFRSLLCQTWPGMDIEPPCVDTSHEKPRLHMFCPEARIPREIFWAGFGFQVWCQMLTHLVQSGDTALFMIDEPDIYLHSDLQRQLLGLLRNLGPDILIATHSTEMITEAETEDIILINKKKSNAQRIKHPSQRADVFTVLGSRLNPILTQLAKTRRVVFVEGYDFKILGKFARKLGCINVGNCSDFAVVLAKGFNPEKVRNLKEGMEITIGVKIEAAVIFDKDYRSSAECQEIEKKLMSFSRYANIHQRKEIENFLLVPAAIDRAAIRKINDSSKRSGEHKQYTSNVTNILNNFASEQKNYLISQYLDNQRRFERSIRPTNSDASVTEAALCEFDELWGNQDFRWSAIPGKDALSAINKTLQDEYGVNVTATSIIDAMQENEVPPDMQKLIRGISEFCKGDVT